MSDASPRPTGPPPPPEVTFRRRRSHRGVRRPAPLLLCVLALAGCGAEVSAPPPLVGPVVEPPASPRPDLRPTPPPTPPPSADPAERRPARAIGTHADGRLERGVRLPPAGEGYVSLDPITKAQPGRAWRRYGTDRLVRTIERVTADFRRANPGAPRVLVGDLSRPRGGVFDRRFGGLGHASHQNGLDVDVYYVRRDGRRLPPRGPGDVDRRLAQDLLDRFLRAGAQVVFTGPNLGLRGPSRRAVPLVHHDDHLHVRLPLRASTQRRLARAASGSP